MAATCAGSRLVRSICKGPVTGSLLICTAYFIKEPFPAPLLAAGHYCWHSAALDDANLQARLPLILPSWGPLAQMKGVWTMRG